MTAPHGSPGDPNLRFIGRWDRRDPAVAHGHWTGHYIRAAFTGTALAVELAAAVNIQVRIDGGPLREIRDAVGVVDLAPAGLAPGTHTVLLTTRREEDELRFRGFRLAPEAWTVAVPALPLIEFIGDSITANAGDAADYADFTVTQPYSWQVAELLGVDHAQIAQSGAPLVDRVGTGDSDRPGMATLHGLARNPKVGPGGPWPGAIDPAPVAPAIVVVNLGTNDRIGQAEFTAALTAFLVALRARHPAAELVALPPFGGAYHDATRDAVAALGRDHRLRFIDTAGWLTQADCMDGVHPSRAGSAKAARHLRDALQDLLSMQAVRARG